MRPGPRAAKLDGSLQPGCSEGLGTAQTLKDARHAPCRLGRARPRRPDEPPERLCHVARDAKVGIVSAQVHFSQADLGVRLAEKGQASRVLDLPPGLLRGLGSPVVEEGVKLAPVVWLD